MFVCEELNIDLAETPDMFLCWLPCWTQTWQPFLPGCHRNSLSSPPSPPPRALPSPLPSLLLYGCCSEVGRACALSVLFFLEGKCGMARVSALGGQTDDIAAF